MPAYRRIFFLTPDTRHPTPRAFTLVEMLIAMAITLVMMAAVVTLFANVTNSVRNRRATIEMTNQLRHVRNVLQQDLQGATCPGIPWQRPESNHGYIEIIEGQYREGNASGLLQDADPAKFVQPTPATPKIDHSMSIIPSSNLPLPAGRATDGSGLGDYDDILMLTVRNEHEPFVGRAPIVGPLNGNPVPFAEWNYESLQSTLAEVIWFAIENPGYTSDAYTDEYNAFFGEPGMRTIYRRALLIAPWLNPYQRVATGDGMFTIPGNGTFKAEPGLMRILPPNVRQANVEPALAALVAFQDQYDVSVRLEWDHSIARWKLVANTLADLTKRENRYGHHFYRPRPSGARPEGREFPFAMVSIGSGYSGNTANLSFEPDIEPQLAPETAATGVAHLDGAVVAFSLNNRGMGYKTRPFIYVNAPSTTIATARAMLNDEGQIIRVIHGPVPLWGERRGEDVMMTDVLAFDLRVYDPGAPLFRHVPTDTMLTPSDPGWLNAYMSNDHMRSGGDGAIGNGNVTSNPVYLYGGQGAYVDLGYGYNSRFDPPGLPFPRYRSPEFSSSPPPWFFVAKPLHDVYMVNRPNDQQHLSHLAPGYAVYDTWSFHYENNGLNEDGVWLDGNTWKTADQHPTDDWRQLVDTGTDGLDNSRRLGVDGVDERETAPPYDVPLRGVQVLIRTYERDSRAIRQVRVNQHFMPE